MISTTSATSSASISSDDNDDRGVENSLLIEPEPEFSIQALHDNSSYYCTTDNYSFEPVAVDLSLTSQLHEPLIPAVDSFSCPQQEDGFHRHHPNTAQEECNNTTNHNNDEGHTNPTSPATTSTVSSSSSSVETAPTFRGLLFYRSIYFLNGLSASAWGRFGIIYYNRVKHLNASQIGILQGVAPVLSFLSQPLWGLVADVLYSRKLVFCICKGFSTLLLLALSLSFVSSFATILVCVAGMSCFTSGGVLDAHTLDYLGEAHRGMYGSIRLWTAVSWGLGAVIMGWITDHCGFAWNFALFGGMMILMLLAVLLGLPARSKSEQKLYDERRQRHNNSHENSNNTNDAEQVIASSSGPRWQVLWDAVARLPVILWLLEVAIIGAGMVIVDSFLFVFLQNELNASTELCGYTVGVTVLLELPIFHYSKQLLSGLGHDVLFLLSMLAYSSRVIGYTYLTPSTAHWVLVLEFSHGITFACMWISSIDYAARVTPKEWSTTVQSLLSTALTCVGGGLGPILAGLVMDRYGPYVMFRGIGIVVGALFVVHTIVLLVFRKGHDKFLEQLQAERQQPRNVGQASNHPEGALNEPLLGEADVEHADT